MISWAAVKPIGPPDSVRPGRFDCIPKNYPAAAFLGIPRRKRRNLSS